MQPTIDHYLSSIIQQAMELQYRIATRPEVLKSIKMDTQGTLRAINGDFKALLDDTSRKR